MNKQPKKNKEIHTLAYRQKLAMRDIQEEWDHCGPPYYFEENKRRASELNTKVRG
ncbi:hypothetical protein ES703_88911 [subsurface metagenome]